MLVVKGVWGDFGDFCQEFTQGKLFQVGKVWGKYEEMGLMRPMGPMGPMFLGKYDRRVEK